MKKIALVILLGLMLSEPLSAQQREEKPPIELPEVMIKGKDESVLEGTEKEERAEQGSTQIIARPPLGEKLGFSPGLGLLTPVLRTYGQEAERQSFPWRSFLSLGSYSTVEGSVANKEDGRRFSHYLSLDGASSEGFIENGSYSSGGLKGSVTRRFEKSSAKAGAEYLFRRSELPYFVFFQTRTPYEKQRETASYGEIDLSGSTELAGNFVSGEITLDGGRLGSGTERFFDRYSGMLFSAHGARLPSGRGLEWKGNVSAGFRNLSPSRGGSLARRILDGNAGISGSTGQADYFLFLNYSAYGDISLLAPSLSVGISVGEGNYMWIKLGSETKLPDFQKLYSEESYVTGNLLVGPERTWPVFQFGVTQKKNHTVRLDLDVCAEEKRGIQTWDDADSNRIWQPVTIPSGSVLGTNAKLLVGRESRLFATIQYSFKKTETALGMIPFVPQNAVTIEGHRRGKIDGVVRAGYIGKRYADEGKAISLKAYCLLGVELRSKVGKGFEVFLRGENLLGSEYETKPYYRGPGASVSAGTRAWF
ncbi:MAG: hypothetical protein QME66_09250 [Candidatus Eisenbacteria bacterium]|nr:hypothetical protein [Candidatus Eisenbacteria bacterium]